MTISHEKSLGEIFSANKPISEKEKKRNYNMARFTQGYEHFTQGFRQQFADAYYIRGWCSAKASAKARGEE